MPGRNDSDGDYRYAFNGMEKDDEIKDIKGSSYDYGARMYDSRVGRWFAMDKNVASSIGFTPYHYVLDNPIRLFDGDGNVQRDCNGNIIVESTGQYTTVTHPSGASWQAEVMNVFADDGTKIQVLRNVSLGVEGGNTNCHGTTFLEGKYWLNNDQVDLLIAHDDGYKEITNPSDIKVGDKLLYEKDQGDGGSDHSVNIVKKGTSKGDATVEGLGGMQTKTSQQKATDAWKKGSDMTIWRKTKPDVIIEINKTVTVINTIVINNPNVGYDQIQSQVGGTVPARTIIIETIQESCPAKGTKEIKMKETVSETF